MKHAQRGQAIFETVLFLPMFLLALFGMIWAVQAAVQYERVESAVRYTGLVSQEANPYAQYSFYALYEQLGSTTLPTFTCLTPLTTPLSDSAPTYTSTQATTASAPFWSPTTSSSGCSGPNPAGIMGIQAGTGLAQDFIINQQYPSVLSSIAVPSYLKSTLGPLTSASASERFFQPVGINVILACYATLNSQINISLNYADDTSSATTPTALGNTVTAITPAASANCLTF
jgi:hypothetical protein